MRGLTKGILGNSRDCNGDKEVEIRKDPDMLVDKAMDPVGVLFGGYEVKLQSVCCLAQKGLEEEKINESACDNVLTKMSRFYKCLWTVMSS